MVPTIVSWFGAEDQFSFRTDEYRPRGDAGRFSLGTPSIPTVYTALGGMEIILEVGMERIRERIDALTGDLVERLRGAGLPPRVAERRERRSGIVTVRVPDSAATVAALAEKGIIVDKRGEYVRISPHFYNTVEENERVVAAMR